MLPTSSKGYDSIQVTQYLLSRQEVHEVEKFLKVDSVLIIF